MLWYSVLVLALDYKALVMNCPKCLGTCYTQFEPCDYCDGLGIIHCCEGNQEDKDMGAREDALAIIARAELDLGKLSIGQRRDLLCDNTAWPTPYIDDMLRHLYPEEMHARNVRKRLKI